MKAANILETIGDTPHIRLNRLFGDRAEVWMKSERANPGASIKDRIALAMIEDAEASGKLKPGGLIIEPTSGNTGIGLAMVAAVKGYKLLLVMPESMSLERRRLMLAYGATFDLTTKEKGMQGAVDRARELIEQNPAAGCRRSSTIPPTSRFTVAPPSRRSSATSATHRSMRSSPGRHRRPHHRLRRGTEAAVAQSQTVRGRARALPDPQRRQAGPHPIQGIGANFIPSILNRDAIDAVFDVDADEAKKWRGARAGGRAADRHLVRRLPGRRGAGARPAWRQAARADIQL